MSQDHEQLRLLSIFHYVFGGLAAFFSLFPLIYVVVGAVFLMAPGEMDFGGSRPPAGEMDALPAEAPVGVEGDAGDVGDVPTGAPFGSGRANDAAMARVLGTMFVVGGLLFFVIGLVCALLVIMAGRNLAACRGYTFCLVVAIVECLSVPIGTVLGVFTIVVLQRESVKALFGRPTPDEAGGYGSYSG